MRYFGHSSRLCKREMSQHLFIIIIIIIIISIKVSATCCFRGNLHVSKGHCTRATTHGVRWPCVLVVLRVHLLEPGLLMVLCGRIRRQVHGDHLSQVTLWRCTTRIPTHVLTLDRDASSRRCRPRSWCMETPWRWGNGLWLDAATARTVWPRLHGRRLIGWARASGRVHPVWRAVHVRVGVHLPHVVARVTARSRRHVAPVRRMVLLVRGRRVMMLHHVAIWHVAVWHLVHVASYHLLHGGGSGGGPWGVCPRKQGAATQRVLVFL
jgi:hypothetical protein